MLALIVVIGAGWVAIQNTVTDDYYDYYTTLEEYCNDEIAYYTRFLETDGSTAEEARQIIEERKYTIELGLTWDDWRYETEAVSLMFSLKRDGMFAEAEQLREILEKNDVKAFLRVESPADIQQSAGGAGSVQLVLRLLH